MRPSACALALFLAACGPVVGTSAGSEAGSNGTEVGTAVTGDDGTTASGTTPSGSDTHEDETTADSRGPSGYEDDDGGTGCTFTCPSPPSTSSSGSGGGGGPNIECSLADQDCPVGEKCSPWANDGGPILNATKCTPLTPDPDQEGEPCTVEGSPVSGVDSCAPGLLCLADWTTNVGTCTRMCGFAGHAPCPGARECTTFGSTFVQLCLQPCAPLSPACLPGEGCYALGADFLCSTPQVSANLAGEPCEFSTHCAAGLYCAHASLFPTCDGPFCCTEFCDTTAADPDAVCTIPGTTCTLLTPDPPSPAWENLGACVDAS